MKFILAGVLAVTATSVIAQELRATYRDFNASIEGPLLKFIGERVTRCSAEDFAIESLPQQALLGSSSAGKAVADGVIDMAVVSADLLREFSEGAAVLSTPFLFSNRAHWERAMDEGVYEAVRAELEERAPFRVLAYLGGAQLGFVSGKELQTLADFQGLRVRTTSGSEELIAAIGASPQQIQFAETYQALRAGSVDAAEFTAVGAENSSAFEIAGMYVRSNHRIFTDFLLVNREIFDGLSDAVRDCLVDAGIEAGLRGRAETADAEAAALVALAERGMRIGRITDRREMFDAAGARFNLLSGQIAAEIADEIISLAACPDWCGDDNCGEEQCDLCTACE